MFFKMILVIILKIMNLNNIQGKIITLYYDNYIRILLYYIRNEK